MEETTVVLLCLSSVVLYCLCLSVVVYMFKDKLCGQFPTIPLLCSKPENNITQSPGTNQPSSSSSSSSAPPTGMKKCLLTSFSVIGVDKSALIHKPGILTDYIANKKFVDEVNICAIINDGNLKFWTKYKYHTVTIYYKGKSAEFQIWDQCGGGDCYKNASKHKVSMLLDLDNQAVERVWGIKNSQDFLNEIASYKIGEKFDEKAVAKKYKLKRA